MRSRILALVFLQALVFALPCLAAEGDWAWVKTKGGWAPDYGYAVATDRSGNVIMGGVLDYHPYIAKYSPSGQELWHFQAPSGPGGGVGSVMAVAVDGDDNILMAGNFKGALNFGGEVLTSAGGYDIFLTKLSSSGAHLWSKRFGGPTDIVNYPSESAFGIAVDANDNSVVITGIFDSTINFGGGPLTTTNGAADLFLVKFRADGTHLWSRKGGAAYGTSGNAVAIDRDGNVLMTGYFSATMDFGGGPITSLGGSDIFIAKYSPSGAFLWVKHYGPYCKGTAITVDSLGNVIVTGTSGAWHFSLGGAELTNVASNNVILAKYAGTDGRHIWSKSFGSTAIDSGTNPTVVGLSAGPNGTITLTGVSASPGIDFGGGLLGAGKCFVANLNGDGTHRWSKAFGNRYERGLAIAMDGNGNSFVIGNFGLTVDFGGQSLTSAGSLDIFLAKFAGSQPVNPRPTAPARFWVRP